MSCLGVAYWARSLSRTGPLADQGALATKSARQPVCIADATRQTTRPISNVNPSFTRAQFEQIRQLLAVAWIGGPADAQEHELDGWLRMLARAGDRLVVVGLGVSKASRRCGSGPSAPLRLPVAGVPLIRINPDPAAAAVPPGACLALRAGAPTTLTAIDARLAYRTHE